MATSRCRAENPKTCPHHGTGKLTGHKQTIVDFFGSQIPPETPAQEEARLSQEANIHYDTFMSLDSTARTAYIQDISMDTYSDIVEFLPTEKLNTFVTAQIFSDADKETAVRSYLEAAIWTATDDIGEPLSDSYDINDFAPEARAQAVREFESFVAKNPLLVADAVSRSGYNYGGSSAVQFGHDFLLTRNGEGAGFWDRESLQEIDLGKQLSEATKEFRSKDTIVGDDGKLYLEG